MNQPHYWLEFPRAKVQHFIIVKSGCARRQCEIDPVKGSSIGATNARYSWSPNWISLYSIALLMYICTYLEGKYYFKVNCAQDCAQRGGISWPHFSLSEEATAYLEAGSGRLYARQSINIGVKFHQTDFAGLSRLCSIMERFRTHFLSQSLTCLSRITSHNSVLLNQILRHYIRSLRPTSRLG